MTNTTEHVDAAHDRLQRMIGRLAGMVLEDLMEAHDDLCRYLLAGDDPDDCLEAYRVLLTAVLTARLAIENGRALALGEGR